MAQIKEDQWIPTICDMCYASCGIKVRRVDGVVADIKGHEDNPNSLGRICAKGKAGILSLYDPYRLKTPLMRTNPEKGIGISPQWKEVGWDEALGLAVEKLRKIKEEDPRGLIFAGLDFQDSLFYPLFKSAFGSRCRGLIPAGYFCGNVLHLVHYLMEGAFFAELDLDYCNYCLLVGSQEGFMANKNPVRAAKKMVAARERGMRLVVVDPVCSTAASKADEWLPIRPGTDGAFALAMLNVLLNELAIYDLEFMRKYTNAPYLIGPQGLYWREEESGKPLVWDEVTGRAFPYDSQEVYKPTLEGTYRVNGVEARPAFQILKEHVKGYSPESVTKITDISADTIRRIAGEFGQAARIGSHIMIEGKELPYRPAALQWTRGAECHKHGAMTGLALQLMNVVVGAIDVPGGLLGNKTIDRAGSNYLEPREGPDGLIMPGAHVITYSPYPARKAKSPESVTLEELFPVAANTSVLFEEGMLDPTKYRVPFELKAMIHTKSNFMMSTSSPKRMSEVLKRVPFVVSFARHLDETVEFADVVFPDAHFLETFFPFPNFSIGFVGGPGSWYRSMAFPVKEPPFQAKPWVEVLFVIAERLGILSDFYAMFNTVLNLKKPYQLDPSKQYTFEEIGDIWSKSWFGPEHGVQMFREKGVFLYSRKKVEEVYPRPFIKGRIPIYQEYWISAGEDLKAVTAQIGLPWDTSDYQPLPDWRPCPAYEEKEGPFDMYAVNYRVPFHAFSTTPQNPWLNELAEHHPYAYKILINTRTAREKGIKDDDEIWVESIAGRVKGRAEPTECIHPEVIGIAGAFGHWAEAMPVAKNKGVHFNTLLPSTLDRVDMLSATLDACVKVKVYKS